VTHNKKAKTQHQPSLWKHNFHDSWKVFTEGFLNNLLGYHLRMVMGLSN